MSRITYIKRLEADVQQYSMHKDSEFIQCAKYCTFCIGLFIFNSRYVLKVHFITFSAVKVI